MASTPRFALITPSYRNDYERAVDLCTSIDRFVEGDFEHLLVVPERDRVRFGALCSTRRRLVTDAQVLGNYGLRELPLPTRLWLPLLGNVRFRQQWWYPGIGRVSGWVTQQLVKLTASELTAAETLLFIDSDVLLIRPFALARLLTADGATRLHRQPMPSIPAEHQHWHRTAHRLLGIPERNAPMFNYIGNLIAWRRATLLELRRRIEHVNGEPWHRAIARAGTVSEYMLYGVFVSEALADAHSPAHAHDCQPRVLAHSVWRPDQWRSAAALAAGIEPQHVALHLQSTLPVTDAARRALIGDIGSYLSVLASAAAAASAAPGTA